ncbi:MAG: RluA family pseudouridine synthase [Tissierellaceae bacterium]|nr:RluA family pseudouridine synthase [Tissierellaceae bacterium]
MDLFEIFVDEDDDERLDAYLAVELNEVSRTYVQRLIKDGLVLVNGSLKKPRYQVREGDFIQVKIPKPKNLEIVAEDIPIDIVYEDEDIVIVNKSCGMVVHPAPGNYTSTLVNALLFHIDNLSTINGIIRPGIVHRLDKDTSGLLIIAKNDVSHKFLSDKLKDRDILREYIAITYGEFKQDEGRINAPIGRDPKNRKKMAINEKNGKEAITDYKVLKRFNGYSLVQANLQTGRTHQIRVHFTYLKHPIVGDPVYSNRKDDSKYDGQLLHAKKIGFIHPRTKVYMEFETDLPDAFREFIEKNK